MQQEIHLEFERDHSRWVIVPCSSVMVDFLERRQGQSVQTVALRVEIAGLGKRKEVEILLLHLDRLVVVALALASLVS